MTMNRTRLHALLVLSMGAAVLTTPPPARAATVLSCNDPYCVSFYPVCDEEEVRAFCQSACGSWEVAVCYWDGCALGIDKVYCTAPEQ
jgi:hypothetical protein